MNDDWSPKKEDVIAVCEGVTERWVQEDWTSCDCCIHCGYEYGNIKASYYDKGIKPPHHKGCIYPIAEDILTGA